MAKGTRDIRRKLKSIKSTRQITKAMELVAASKMRRAVQNTVSLRPYASLASLLLQSLSEKTDPQLHPLLTRREKIENILVILLSTDKGLCGGLNTQLFRSLTLYLKEEKGRFPDAKFSFITVGKKGSDFLRRIGETVTAAYPAMSVHPSLKDTFPISRMILKDYIEGKIDRVILIYTDFISAISQKPRTRRLLPLSRHALEEMIEGIGTQKAVDTYKAAKQSFEYLFEPSPNRVLSMLLPRLTEMQIYQAILEATASEHSARMFAMRNATDNATELINDLTLTYNSLRQASITAELAEISAGRAALG